MVYDALLSPRAKELYADTGVLTETEKESRAEVLWEQYGRKIEIESRVLSDMTLNHILPVATRYQSVLLDNVSKIKESFPAAEFRTLASNEIDLIRDISSHISEARSMARKMDVLCDELARIGEERERSIRFHDEVVPLMESTREHVDALEMIIDDQMWPLPKYREMLFIH